MGLTIKRSEEVEVRRLIQFQKEAFAKVLKGMR